MTCNRITSSMMCIDYFYTDNNNNNQFCGACVCISNEGNIYSFGKSISGLHGHKKESITSPKIIKGLNDIKMIFCGGNHTCCLDYSGNSYTFGSNDLGQLGIGKTKDELEFTYKPQQINLPPCKQIACGSKFTVWVTEDNKLFACGYNGSGQLASNTYTNRNIPQLITLLSNVEIEFIDCGAYHSICKTYDNDLYSWGYNKFGQLGHGDNETRNIPIKCINWPDNIIDIKSGTFHSLLLTEEGQVYSIGNNDDGQTGVGEDNLSINIPILLSNIPEIKRIECGYTHSMCIDINNNLWVFGLNGDGQLGLGDKINRFTPTKNNNIQNIQDISSGGDNIFIKTIDNKIYANGYNGNEQIGIKTEQDYQLTPIQVLKGKEDIWCSTIRKSRAKSARK